MSEIPFSIRSRRGGGGTASTVNDLGGMNFSTLDDNELMKRVDANNVGGSGLVAIEVPEGFGTVSSHIMFTNEGGNILSSFISQTDSVTNEYTLQMKPQAVNPSTTALTIKDDGSAETKVGINIADPEETLDIEGNLQLRSGAQGKIFFKHPSGLQKVELDGNQDGTNGGKFIVKTKVDGSSMTQKFEINNKGAIGLGATPTYVTTGQVLTSNGSVNPPQWVTPAGGALITPVYVAVLKNGDQAINVSAAITTFAPVDGMTIDNQSGFDYNISTGEFTAPRAGIYMIDYAINLIDNNPTFTEYCGAVVSVNRGSGYVREMTQNYSDTQRDTLLITIRAHYMTQLNAGDIVKNELEIYNTNTTVATIRGSSTTTRGTYQTIHSIT